MSTFYGNQTTPRWTDSGRLDARDGCLRVQIQDETIKHRTCQQVNHIEVNNRGQLPRCETEESTGVRSHPRPHPVSEVTKGFAQSFCMATNRCEFNSYACLIWDRRRGHHSDFRFTQNLYRGIGRQTLAAFVDDRHGEVPVSVERGGTNNLSRTHPFSRKHSGQSDAAKDLHFAKVLPEKLYRMTPSTNELRFCVYYTRRV